MKILLQNQYDGALGGVETYFQLIVKTLLEKGHEVIAVYTFSGKKSVMPRDNFKALYLPNLDLPEEVYFSQKRNREIKQDLRFLQSIVEKEKPDIIHLHNTYYPAQFSFLHKYAPLIQTVHDFFNCCPTLLKMFTDEVCTLPAGIDCFKKGCVSPKSIRELWRFKTKYINREAMKAFDRHLVTTEYMKEMLLCNRFDEGKINVVPLFVEDGGVKAEPREDVIIYVGRLAREKGILHFIHMLKLIKTNLKAFVIGEGPQREECENLIRIMGLEDKIKFTGFLNREQLKEYFLKSRVVVIPSLWPEPFCLVGLEAISFSKPVVAYNVGGISSWLRDNYNGYLVKRADTKELAHAVETLLRNRKLAEDMGNNGRSLFEEKFTQKQHFTKLFSIYESVAQEKKMTKRRLLLAKVTIFPQDKKCGLKDKSKYLPHRYPERFPEEPLPEYNKRVIAYEIQNNICIVKSYPEEITISTTTRCNMDPPCVMCERNLRSRDDERDLDEKVLEKVKPIFKYADRIYLHCGGEPLITERSLDIIESVSPPTKIIFNTNGALFTEKIIHHMVDCGVIDIISFSIDAATERTYRKIRSAEFNKIISHIEALVKYRNIKNRDKPLLRPLVLMNFCIFKQNIYEVPDYVLLGHRLGVDGIDFSHMNKGFDWQQKRKDYTFDYKKEHVTDMGNIEDHDEQIVKAYELGKKCNMPINFNGNPFIGTPNEHKVEIKRGLSELIKYGKRCIAPWNRAAIEPDGRIRICCFHHSAYQTIGKLDAKQGAPYFLQSNSLEEIWNGEEAVSVRKEFIEKGIAKRCITRNPCIFQNRI